MMSKDNNTEEFAELAYKLKLKMALKKKAKLKSPNLEKPGLQPKEVKDLALRLLKKQKMTNKMKLEKEGPALTFGGVPILTPEMILELKERKKRKEQMELELMAKLQEELKLELENKHKNKPQPRSKKKIKPNWI